jgi:hypothetical protein
MWVVLNTIPRKGMPCTVIRQGNVCPARKVTVEILPLHISRAKG